MAALELDHRAVSPNLFPSDYMLSLSREKFATEPIALPVAEGRGLCGDRHGALAAHVSPVRTFDAPVRSRPSDNDSNHPDIRLS